MDIFKNIDWNPSLEDVIDNEFINSERLEEDTFMYSLMRGGVNDPMQDIADDFLESITAEDINNAAAKSAKQSKTMKAQAQSASECLDLPKKPGDIFKKYVPAIQKQSFPFPRPSRLTAEQHELCLKVLLEFSRSQKPENLSVAAKEDLKTYLSLQKIINEEQDEFLELAKKNWKDSGITPVRDDLVNLKWNAKIKKLQQLPRYYTDAGSISFTRNQEIELEFGGTLLQMGVLPRVFLPTLKNRCRINVDHPKIKVKYFSPQKLANSNNVSTDNHCNTLANDHEVDLVISSSGLHCIASNLNQSHASPWILPVTVKEIKDRIVIFIDKPLPPTAKNRLQKNTWVYKYILKNYTIHPAHMTSIALEVGADQLQTEHYDDNLEDIFDERSPTAQPDKSLSSIHNVQYNIFTIGACGTLQNELMKDKIEKDYRILVRTKIDGVEKLKSGEIVPVKIVPKLENQISLGSEAVTLEEAARQWISLKFTPEASLIRARVCPQLFHEYVQTEKRSCTSINNELKRLYNVRGEDILPLLYNIIDGMKRMSSGMYLVRYTAHSGAFATILKESANMSPNCVDLQAIYCDTEFKTVPSVPWPLIDKTVPTPALIVFNRMPAMYYPTKFPSLAPAKSKNYTPPKTKKRKTPAKKSPKKVA